MIQRKIFSKKENLRITLFLCVFLLASACATVEKPDGGPKDTTPPKAIAASPADSTVCFNNNRIVIEFNEFVKLNSPTNQVLINPFPKEKPELTVQGKKVRIFLKDSLIPNTTYHIFFGNAIQDITENNSASGLEYVFSTGHVLDSCTLKGFAGDAFTNKFTDKAWVMLYKNLSEFRDTMPIYIAHVNNIGAYTFRNLAPGTYYICALEDNNSNFKFDLPDENIAFLNKPIVLSPENHSVDSVNMYLFAEQPKDQKHLKTEMTHYHTVRSSFRLPMNNPEITILNKAGNTSYNWNREKDTVLFYIKGKDADSLKYIIRDGQFCDTLAQGLNIKGRVKNFATDTILKIGSSAVSEKFAAGDKFFIIGTVPLESWDTSKIICSVNKDTVPAVFKKDDETGNRWKLNYEIKPGDNCILIINKGAVTDIFGFKNDSTRFSFRMVPADELGTMEISLMNLPGKPLLFSATGKEKNYSLVVEPEDETIAIENIFPGEYELKIVVDENEDGKWTPGEFSKQLQPEKVFTLPRPVLVKKGFESKVSWNLAY
jgi:hypothetical protein